MNFLELAQRRRSVRRYSNREVPRELVDKCLDAARRAPSACGSEPWFFHVIDDPSRRFAVAEAALSGLYGMNRFMREAPVLIAVQTERSKYSAKLGGLFRGVQFSLIDIGIAVDHLTLQAAELDLGTCWIGWFNEKAVKKALSLPASAHIDIMLTMGYPTDETPASKKRKNLDEIRRYL